MGRGREWGKGARRRAGVHASSSAFRTLFKRRSSGSVSLPRTRSGCSIPRLPKGGGLLRSAPVTQSLSGDPAASPPCR